MVISSQNAYEVLTHSFFDLYPGEIAGHLKTLPLPEILLLLKKEPIRISVNVFMRLNPDIAANLINLMDEAFFKDMFSRIDPALGVTIMARLDEDMIDKHLDLLTKDLADEYLELMSYPPGTAGQLMDPRVTCFKDEDTVEFVLETIRSVGDRRILDICVTNEEGILIGVVPLQHVACARPEQRINDLIYRDPITVNIMDPREDIVKLLEDRKLTSLPVVNPERKLLGVIHYDALVTAAQYDASQDMQAMFGAGRDEGALSKISFAIRKRLPWLEINLATAFLAATVVGLFEDTIARFTALAVFLPVVAGQSGNTGSQALAVTMRGLALREIRTRHWFRVAKKEVSVGFINGLVVSLTTSLVVYFWMSSIGLAMVIGISMVFSMVIAGLSGAVIPIILKAFGQDPAQSSSIILTTVTDVVGFMSFLGLATLLAGMLNVS